MPQRETGMTPYEIMLSESQERMLLVAARGREEESGAIFAKWELDAVEIGTVTGDGMLRVRFHGAVVAEVPVGALADEAPVYEKPTARPGWQDALEAFDPLALARPSDAAESAAGPGGLARHRLEGVGVSPVRPAGRDQLAGAPRLGRGRPPHQGHPHGVAVTTDCNARFVYLDPRRGRGHGGGGGGPQPRGQRARPLGLTDCLNFGSPERPEILWQFKEAVAGHHRGLPGARNPRGGRQRLLLQ